MKNKFYKTTIFLKIGFAASALAVVFAVVGAASAQTRSDFDKGYNFGALKTWRFANEKVNAKDATGGKNPMWDDNLRRAIAAEMQKKGFAESSDNPDFLVRYRLGTKEKMKTEVVRDDFPGFAYHRGGWIYWRGGWSQKEVFRTPFDETTLVVDIVDARSKELVWRGYDTRTIDTHKSDKTLTKAAEKVVTRFGEDARKEEKRVD